MPILRTWRRRALALVLSAVLAPLAAAANDDLRYDIGGGELSISGLFTTGAAIRLQDRATDLLGKTDVPGQQSLCAGDDCMSLRGDTAPNQRLVDAKGAYSGINSDNGNLNYDRYDLIAATSKLTPKLTYSNGLLVAKLRGILYYDPVNTGFTETRNNTLLQPEHSARPTDISRRFAHGYKWREAFVTVGNESYSVTVGNQLVTWGEASLTQFNIISAVNPLDANVVRMPGSQVNEYLRPVPAITALGELGYGVTAELFYQLQQIEIIPDATGSFFSTNNVLGGGKFAIVGLGQYVQDPNRQYKPPFPNLLITSSTRTAYLLSDNYGKARDDGQFGAQFKYLADTLNDGTEFGLQYLHYHSRVPSLSAIAANASCTRQGAPGSFASALVACTGFNGQINPLPGKEPLPVDTLRPFLDYPEDIDMIGASFNTTLLHWSLAGEYSFRPNMPLQIAISDVIFAAESPAFPVQDIPVPANAVGSAAPFTIPGNRTAVPDFLSVYRGTPIAPNSLIRGYERFKVGQFALTGIRQLSSTENPFGADAVTLVVEVSGTSIFDLPNLNQLQLEGAGDRTHHSAGADGTGDPSGEANSLRINPTQQNHGYASAFSWGYRALARLAYENVIGGINFTPALLFFHDVHGISPASAPNYVEGRKTLYAVLESRVNADLTVNLQYQMYTGGGKTNLLRDRDNLSFSLAYAF